MILLSSNRAHSEIPDFPLANRSRRIARTRQFPAPNNSSAGREESDSQCSTNHAADRAAQRRDFRPVRRDPRSRAWRSRSRRPWLDWNQRKRRRALLCTASTLRAPRATRQRPAHARRRRRSVVRRSLRHRQRPGPRNFREPARFFHRHSRNRTRLFPAGGFSAKRGTTASAIGREFIAAPSRISESESRSAQLEQRAGFVSLPEPPPRGILANAAHPAIPRIAAGARDGGCAPVAHHRRARRRH